MKKTVIKNIAIFTAGAIITISTGLFAASIDANINSFTQYIQNLFVTSNGTPTGTPRLSVDENGVRIYDSYTLPTNDGATDQVLTTNGQGQLSWESIGASTNEIQTIVVYVSYLDILNIGTNPVELVPAPGIGKFIQPLEITIRYIPGETSYTMMGGNLVVYQGANPYQYNYVFSNILSSLDPSMSMGYDGSGLRSIQENEALKLSTEDFINPINGDGSLQVYVTYKIIDLAALPN